MPDHYEQHPPLIAPVSWITCGADVLQQPPDSLATDSEQQLFSAVAAGAQQAMPRSSRIEVVQTPVSGSTSWTSRADSQSPAMAAAIERTCSYPVSIRKVGARP